MQRGVALKPIEMKGIEWQARTDLQRLLITWLMPNANTFNNLESVERRENTLNVEFPGGRHGNSPTLFCLTPAPPQG